MTIAGPLGRVSLRQPWKYDATFSAPIVATDRQFSVGSIFSSPLVVGGVVYFGSADGNLYALE